MFLADLPNELICLVGQHLPQAGISSLMRTSHLFYRLLQKTLYDNTPKHRTHHYLIWACEHDREHLAREMLKRGAVTYQLRYGPRPLEVAAEHGSLDVVKCLLEEGTDPNLCYPSTHTPLIRAATRGHIDVVKTLLRHRDTRPEQPDGAGQTPFAYAAENGHVLIMRKLLETGQVDPNRQAKGVDRSAPIHHAAWKGREEVMRFILSLPGADPEFRDANGRTPLSLAARAGASGVVKILLDTGRVDPNARDSKSMTPLHLVVDMGQFPDRHINGHYRDLSQEKQDSISLLAGTVIPQRLEAGKTRMERTEEHTITNDGWEVMRQLLAFPGIDPDARDSEGRTPLSYAAVMPEFEAMRLLIATGKVDLESKDNDGWTPADWLERQVKVDPTEEDEEFEGRGCMICD